MANQLLALQVKPPVFDYPNAVRTAQQMTRGNQEIEQAGMANDLSALKLRDFSNESNAVQSYRDAREAGDPKAIEKLKAYPELQAKLHQAFESMKPDEAKAARKRAEAFGSAAQYVMSFEAGSPERAAAWSKSVDELAKSGYATPEQADHWKKAGPSDLILDQALTVDAFVKSYKGGNDIPEATKEIEDGVANFRETITPKDFMPSAEQQAEIEQRVQAERARLQTVYGSEREGLGNASGGASPKGDLPIDKNKDQSRIQPEDAPAPAAAESAKGNQNNVDLGKRPRAVNKKTGEIIEFDGKTWVPVK